MLIELRISNFGSIKDEVILSLVASSDRTKLNNVHNMDECDIELLKVCAIYGANASGKSHVCNAIGIIRALLVIFSLRDEGRRSLPYNPFKLDENLIVADTVIEVTFLFRGPGDDKKVRYQYGISYNQERINEEWLYSYPHKRPRLLFERQYDSESNSPDIKFGGYWPKKDARLVEKTRERAPFLAVASEFNHPVAKAVEEYFLEHVKLVSPNIAYGESDFTADMCHGSEEKCELVLQVLKFADTGITALSTDEMPLTETPLFRSIPKKLIDEIKKESGEPPAQVVWTTEHEVKTDSGEYKARFESSEESDGTQKLFAIAGPIIHALDNGLCLFADELSNRLHPLLALGIIKLFQNKELNRNGAQLVFTTHNLELLSPKGPLRRDQIWLTEKRSDGSTDLYSLWDMKIRKDEDWKKGYMAGRYGAIPYIDRLVDPEMMDKVESKE